MARFIQLLRAEPAEELLRFPNAFALLTLIALRARREVPQINPHGLRIGEAMLGDHAAVGLSRQEFRSALSNLQKWSLITTRTTNKGTIAKLSGTSIYDINAGATSQQPASNQPTTSQQPADNQPATSQQPADNQPATTNKNVKNVIKKEGEESNKPTPSLRSVRGDKEPEHFAAFWQAYPRKESKATALKAFEKLSPEEQAAAPLAAREWFGRRTDWQGADGTDYRPHPTTWLNQKRWTDLTEITITQNQPNPHATESFNPHPQRNAYGPRSGSGAVFVNDELRRASEHLLSSINWGK